MDEARSGSSVMSGQITDGRRCYRMGGAVSVVGFVWVRLT
jgi:hypothetical protein